MASTFFNSPRRTYVADSDLSAKQFYIMKAVTAYNHCDIASSATDLIIGTLQNAPKSGDVADVQLNNSEGTALVIAGGTVAVGDKLTSDSSGKAIATTTGGNVCIGTAVNTAVSGDIFEYAPAVLIVR